jgi:hypothetical protein
VDWICPIWNQCQGFTTRWKYLTWLDMSDALEKIVNEKIWKFEHLYIFIIDGSVVSLLIVGPKYDLNKIEIASCRGYSEIFSFTFFE